MEIARDIDASLSDMHGPGSKNDTIRVVGRFDPRTDVFWNEFVEVSVDVVNLHFFDLATGISLRT
ncbi:MULTISPECIES: hypothetical protein [unclassified Agrobacterium]|uniref:hypothetical protein n=1 Tax=unclassified Agrobacterium TaxID=2632611 RepID=UPI001ADB6E95|nr:MULTISPECIES: hypothetical protein [unclassified Agrobacterium]QXZ76070.1 hypothetical protein J5276_28845 [Agrobacterium sp. S7/73]